MRNRKLSILACCVAVGIGSYTQSQPATDDDQAKALEALRQAEHAQPEPPAKAKKKAKKEKKKAEEAAAPVAPVAAPVAATPPPPTGVPASTPDDDARLLEALHQAEHVQAAPVVVSTPVVVTPTPEPAPVPVVAAPAPAIVPPAVAATPANSDDDARVLEALHQAQQQQAVPSAEVSRKDMIEAEKIEARKKEEAIKAQQQAERLAAMRAARIEAEAKAHREAAEKLLREQQYQKDKAKLQTDARIKVEGTGAVAANASSPEDDARVLAALRDAEHGNAPAPTAPAAVVAAPAPAAVVAAPAAVVAQPAPAPVAVVGVPATSSEDNARELDALRKAELGQAAPPAEAVAAPEPAVAVAVPASSPDENARALKALHQAEHGELPPPKAIGVAPSPWPGDKPMNSDEATKRKRTQEEVAKRLEKLERDLNGSTTVAAKVSAPAASSATATASVASAPARAPGSRPVITAEKEQRLADLLRLYKSDQITPLQYHSERAKILAEP